VITPQQQIRRRTDGSIDIDFYHQRALAARAAMLRSGEHLPAAMLMANAVTLTLAGALVVASMAAAGMMHIVKAALWGAA
jgi:hypothetical protein